MNRSLVACAAALFLGAFAAAQTPTGKPAQTPAESLPTIRFGGIPGPDKAKLTELFEPVAKALQADLNRPVVYVHFPDAAGAATALAADKLDFAWLDAVSAVQAEELTGNKARILFARVDEVKPTTYLIATKSLVDAGKLQARSSFEPQGLEALAALKPAFKECTFTFGAPLSPAGSIWPRYFMEVPEVGIDPERDFEAKPDHQAQDAAVLKDVAGGGHELGAIDAASWQAAPDELKAKAPVVCVTPAYRNECMVVHPRVGPVLPLRVMSFFVKLDEKKPADKAILDAFRTQRFDAVNPRDWEGVRKVLRSAKARGILQ
jgi:phosphonate transport system substrate-binding protein